jgi:hypothetical protein
MASSIMRSTIPFIEEMRDYAGITIDAEYQLR